MGSDEIAIIEYLKQFPKTFTTVTEISKRATGRRRYARDPEWARPVLHRMEAEGHLESNGYGHYKLMPALLAKYTSGYNKMVREDRCRQAVSTHVLNMPPEDDHKTFTTLIREALSNNYASEIGLGEPLSE